jgi:cell division protein FtsI/penicillin-binding protein 2
MARLHRNPNDSHQDIPAKANRVLNIVLIGMLLILIRVWHLAIIQYDEKLEESRKPQRHIMIEPAKRATIRDRFNIPLAINKIHYQAAISYSQIRVIPSVKWEKDLSGKRIKILKRRDYIKNLSQLLADELNLDSERLEDLIHSKASCYSQIPFIIKEDLSEREYYRLKMLEKDWLGITVLRVPKRHYPQGRVAADIIGFMGAINR